MNKLFAWFENRTGAGELQREMLYENIPYGARFRYVTGSMLVFAFATQVITGLFLWMAYSPSSQTAWESVYYIQYEMTGGWLLRGIHHFMAQAMMVVMGLHLLQVIIDGAYKAPREINYWLGLVLLQLVMGLGLTGYLLPWHQQGYWATNVATNLMTLVPFAGKEIQQIALGGSDYGHHTLTRFFAMHAGVLPAMLIGFLVLHIAMFRKHGITPYKTPNRPDEYFFPRQVLFDGISCLVLLTIVLLLTINWNVAGLVTGDLPVESRGVELGAPADPAEPYDAARPEWYFLFLFQLLKYFDGSFYGLNTEDVGALVVPGIIFAILAAAPVIAWSKRGHAFNVGFVLFLLAGATLLTVVALVEDANNPDFHIAAARAEEEAHRTRELIHRKETIDGVVSKPKMIPREGAVYLVRNDPKLQGPRLFQRHCASCHSYTDPAEDGVKIEHYRLPEIEPPKPAKDGSSAAPPKVIRKGGKVQYNAPEMTAPDLYGFASRDWVRGLLNPEKVDQLSFKDAKIEGSDKDAPGAYRQRVVAPYFGNTAHADGEMVQFVKSHFGAKAKDSKRISDEDTEAIVVALSAQAQLPAQLIADKTEFARVNHGLKLIKETCATHCHRAGDEGEIGYAPDLTGYGSYEWTMGLVANPGHVRYYGGMNDRMPVFAPTPDSPAGNVVNPRELSLIVDWIRGEYYKPDDRHPRLPHTEEQARAAVRKAVADDLAPSRMSRPVEDPAATLAHKAELLFRGNCSSCHTYLDPAGRGIASSNPSAPNLYGFGSREWTRKMLTPGVIDGPQMLGNSGHFEGEMVNFVNDELTELEDEDQEKLDNIIIALSAMAELPYQAKIDKEATTEGLIEKGEEQFSDGITGTSCADCHSFEAGEEGDYPNLHGYASRDWLKRFIANASHPLNYGENNDRMPVFHYTEEEQKANPALRSRLSEADIDLLSRWLRREKLTD